MIIPCPFCGERSHAEFTYGGDAEERRPAVPADATDEAWCRYLYFRDNPAGAHAEYWHHSLGCARWIVLTRDTLTHRISAGRLADEAEARSE